MVAAQCHDPPDLLGRIHFRHLLVRLSRWLRQERRGGLCPQSELEEGVGVTLSASEVCRDSGYLCTALQGSQVTRRGLDKGKLRIRVPPPDLPNYNLSKKAAEQLRAAVVEGIKAIAIHEIGHSLGIRGHSDSTSDIMYPQMLPTTREKLSDRDLQTIDALYKLPNGATVQ